MAGFLDNREGALAEGFPNLILFMDASGLVCSPPTALFDQPRVSGQDLRRRHRIWIGLPVATEDGSYHHIYRLLKPRSRGIPRQGIFFVNKYIEQFA
jgi:hypothetical protein